MKRTVSIILSCCILVIALVACSSKSNKTVTVTILDSVSVSEGKDNKIDITEDIVLPENVNAGECFRQLCNKHEIIITGVDEGFVTTIDSIANEGDYAWMFYINGELAENGIKDYIPKNSDRIMLSYVNWTELFAQ